MEHAEARELLEIAAVEPGGFERLAAGDTLDSAALAGHLAACSACAAEMERLRRDAAIVREGVRSLPPADLRERTLAFVAAVGRPRSVATATGVGVARTDADATGPAPSAASVQAGPTVLADAHPRRGPRSAIRRTGLWAATLAAAVVVAIVGTALVVGRPDDTAADQIAGLTRVATWSLRIDGQPDARHVDLASTDAASAPATGSLLFSPMSEELVVLAEGLPPAPPGQEYRCWVDSGAGRTRVGRMFFAGELAFWAGPVPGLGEVPMDGVRFGVTLVPADGDSLTGEPVLLGEL